MVHCTVTLLHTVTFSYYSYTLGLIAVCEQEKTFNAVPMNSTPQLSAIMESLKSRADLGFDLFQGG